MLLPNAHGRAVLAIYRFCLTQKYTRLPRDFYRDRALDAGDGDVRARAVLGVAELELVALAEQQHLCVSARG